MDSVMVTVCELERHSVGLRDMLREPLAQNVVLMLLVVERVGEAVTV